MNQKQASRRVQKIREAYAKMREQFWPEVTENMLWHQKEKKKVGFSQIPRCITFMGIIMDALSKSGKISSTYLALWCHTFDEGFVSITNPQAMAFESGFSKGRAVNTWKSRMDELVRLGFIKVAPGAGPYDNVLILNPYKVIKRLREEGKIIEEAEAAYNALLKRASDIGAAGDL
jgi:hypothetical protein